ncbi:hypothetical protein CA11_05060 [Gimesia maris]|uniref:hypothetical protein n=1 Tax=Gimesia maris TaxID=122 RepID=UPI00118A24C0|nr:hypothetical protein [Gimesia maris]QDU12726.1 hypothetical protein CA11_05060 [Gimesia maris]
MNQESRYYMTCTSRLVIALLTITVAGLTSVMDNRAHADQPIRETNASASDLFEKDSPSAAQIARLKLREAAKAAPDKLHAIGLSCHNPMGWKLLVYLPPDKAWKLYAAIRPIPFPVLVQPAPEDGNFNIHPAPQGRIVQLEGSLSLNDEGNWQIVPSSRARTWPLSASIVPATTHGKRSPATSPGSSPTRAASPDRQAPDTSPESRMTNWNF